MSKRRIALAVVLALIATGGVLYAIAAMAPVQPMWSSSAEPPKEKRWQAVAPGRVEACSGHIKVASADGERVWLSSGNWQSSNQAPWDFTVPGDKPPLAISRILSLPRQLLAP